jgi:small subunit ribosomal protein S16
MAVRIRLQRRGAHKKPYYHVVVADSRAPRDGKFIEKIGSYNPLREPPEISIQTDLYDAWVRKGAQPSKAVEALFRRVKASPPAEGAA